MPSEDGAAIEALVFGYAERIDTGDFAAVGELFRDASYRSSGGGEYRGADAVREVLKGLVRLYDGVPRTRHVTTNLVIEIDDSRATAQARSYFTVLQATDDLPLQIIAAGRYHDRFERVEGVWRFADRLIHLDLLGDLSRHLGIGRQRQSE